MRMMAVAGLVGSAAAQCTLPAALPEDTQFAAGNPAECVLGKTERAVLSRLLLLVACAPASVCGGSGLVGGLSVSLCARARACLPAVWMGVAMAGLLCGRKKS